MKSFANDEIRNYQLMTVQILCNNFYIVFGMMKMYEWKNIDGLHFTYNLLDLKNFIFETIFLNKDLMTAVNNPLQKSS